MAKKDQQTENKDNAPDPKAGESAQGAAAVTSNVNMKTKLSPKTICGNVAVPLKPDGKPYVDEDGVPTKFPPVHLYRVIGRTHGLKTGTGDNGPWVAFLGMFEATRVKDRAVFQGGQCFVPRAVEDALAATLLASQEKDPKATVEFAIDVGIEFAQTKIGYQYWVKNLVKPSGADPLQALRLQLQAPEIPQLPALPPPLPPPAA